MDIQHPYYQQGIQKIITCIQESAIGSRTGKLIKFNAEEFMLESGIPFSHRTVNWDIIGEYVTPSWFGHLAKFVSAQELDIKDNFHFIKLLRQHDDYIMLQFIEQGYRKKELSILNHMRMSIHAISLSDITTLDGLMVSQNAFLLLSSNSLREGYDWPPSPPKFSNQQKQLWKTAIQATFVTSHPNNNDRKLRPSARLGLWMDKSVQQKWTTFFSQEEELIYK